jgi:hypothetical protein
MNSYYTVRISLNDLEKDNEKQEYRALYAALKDEGFVEAFFAKDDLEYILPQGMYAIKKFDFLIADVRNKAEDAIETALSIYYESGWTKKYTLIVSGPSQILSRNLDAVEEPM